MTRRCSASVRSRHGTSVRTPSLAATSGMWERPSIRHGATAPSVRVSEPSGTSPLTSTSFATPSPWHTRQAPRELNAKDSADGSAAVAPHLPQVILSVAQESMLGGTGWPFGHGCVPRRLIIRRRTALTSVIVATVDRGPGTGGRWRSASVAGRWPIESTSGETAWVIRRRV